MTGAMFAMSMALKLIVLKEMELIMKTFCLNLSEMPCEGIAGLDETEQENQTCPAVGYQRVSVCAPVEVKPFAIPGATRTTCCGKPVIKPGKATCHGDRNGSCFFTISQKLCIEVPVEFGANTVVGDTFVKCLGVSQEDTCNDCDDSLQAEQYFEGASPCDIDN